MRRVYVPKPLEHQRPADRGKGSRKVIRAGRRGGKTKWAVKAAIVGHGPNGVWSRAVRGQVVECWSGPKFRGISHNGTRGGLHVYWIARDLRQFKALWRGTLLRMFRGTPQVEINKSDHTITLPNDGMLCAQTAENIESVRGSGELLIGVIIDEAAWQDLEDELKSIVLPILIDNGGWLVLLSTTNAGLDGNKDQRVPSYFNILCADIRESVAARERGEVGVRDEDWEEFYFTAFDNPRMDPDAIRKLISEYTPDSLELKQEVYAELVTIGAGLAFPEWSSDAHIAQYDPPRDDTWVWSGGGDWGSSAPGWLGLMATGHQRSLVRVEFSFNGPAPRHLWSPARKRCLVCGSENSAGRCVVAGPKTVGHAWGRYLMERGFPMPDTMWVDTPPVAMKGPTILERLEEGYRKAIGRRAHTMWLNPPKGAGSRATKKQLLHDLLRYERAADGKVHDWNLPDLQVHRECAVLIETLPKLTRDPHPARAEDVNTGLNDHPYDGLTAWVMGRVPEVQRPVKKAKQPNRGAPWSEIVRQPGESETVRRFQHSERRSNHSEGGAAW